MRWHTSGAVGVFFLTEVAGTCALQDRGMPSFFSIGPPVAATGLVADADADAVAAIVVYTESA